MSINILYSSDPPLEDYTGNSIFLAGPTPRSKDVQSWRPEAVDLFRDREALLPFDLTLCYPEYKQGEDTSKLSYSNQIDWESQCLENCGLIMFWVPRKLDTMPAFTTNIEFGEWMARDPLKVVYGHPYDAVNMQYMDYKYKKINHNQPMPTLMHTVKFCTYYIRMQFGLYGNRNPNRQSAA